MVFTYFFIFDVFLWEILIFDYIELINTLTIVNNINFFKCFFFVFNINSIIFYWTSFHELSWWEVRFMTMNKASQFFSCHALINHLAFIIKGEKNQSNQFSYTPNRGLWDWGSFPEILKCVPYFPKLIRTFFLVHVFL